MQVSQATVTQIKTLLLGNPSNYTLAYNLVISDLAAQNLTLTSDQQDVVNWFNTAYQVNSGSISSFDAVAIRAVNQAAVQYETGKIIPLFGSEQQDASNAIANTVLSSIVNNNGIVPDFSTIQNIDAQQGLKVLDVSQAAWAGATSSIFTGFNDPSYYNGLTPAEQGEADALHLVALNTTNNYFGALLVNGLTPSQADVEASSISPLDISFIKTFGVPAIDSALRSAVSSGEQNLEELFGLSTAAQTVDFKNYLAQANNAMNFAVAPGVELLLPATFTSSTLSAILKVNDINTPSSSYTLQANSDGSSSVSANSQLLNYVTPDITNMSFTSAGDLLAKLTPNSGNGTQETFDLASTGITETTGNSSFSDTLANTKAIVDALGNVQFVAPTTWGNTATYTMPANGGNGTFTVGRDTINLNSDVASLSGSNGVFNFGLTPLSSSFSEGLTWNSNTGYATLNIGYGASSFSSALGQINPGESFIASNSAFSLWNGSGQELSSTTVNASGVQNDYTYNIGAGLWASTDWVYNGAGVQLAIDYANKDGSAVNDFYDPNRNEAMVAQQFLNPTGSSSLSADNDTIAFAAGDKVNVAVGAAGDVDATVTPSSGVAENIDVTTSGIAVTANGSTVANDLANSSTSVDAAGNVNFAGTISPGNNGFLTVGANGNDTFTVGRDSLDFTNSGLTSLTNNNGVVNFGLSSPDSSVTESLLWNPAVGKAILSMTNPTTGQTATTSAGWVDPGDTLTANGSVVNLSNSSGQLLNSTQTFLGGGQNDTSYDVSGGLWKSTTYSYNIAGQLTGNTYVNNDGSAVVDIYNPNTGSLAQQTIFAAAGGYVSNFYDALTGSWIATKTYNNVGALVNEALSPSMTSSQFITTTLDTLAGQTISQFLLKNDLPASLAAQAFSNAGIQSVANYINGTSPTASNFSTYFASSLTSMAGGILGADEGAALFKDLGLPTQLGSLTGNVLGEAAAQQLTSYIAQTMFDVPSSSALGGSILNSTLSAQNFASSLGSSFLSAGFGLAGSELEQALFQNRVGPGAEIGEAIGAAVGSFFGPLGTFVGSFFGEAFGGQFGAHPSVGPNGGTWIEYSASTNTYVVGPTGVDNGGDPSIPQSLAAAAINTLNPILAAIGGTIIGYVGVLPSSQPIVGLSGGLQIQPVGNPAPTSAFVNGAPLYSFGYFKGQYFAADQANDPAMYQTNTFANASDAVSDGVFRMLKGMQITGGDALMEYVLIRSDASNLTGLLSDLNVAHDYEEYTKNPTAFDVAVAMGGPTQINAWLAELSRAQVLGLDKLTVVGDPQIVVTDSAANIQSSLSMYEQMATSGLLNSIKLTDATKPTLTLSASDYANDQKVLGMIVSPYNLAVTNVAAASAVSLSTQANVTSVTISDTAANVNCMLDALKTLATSGKLAAVQLTDSTRPTFTLTAAQLTGDAAVLAKITSLYNETVLAPNQVSASMLAKGLGANTLSFIGASSAITADLSKNTATQTVTTGTGTLAHTTTYTDTLGNFQALVGSPFNDTLIAGAGNEILTGSGGYDTMIGSTSGGTTFADVAKNFVQGDLIKNFINGSVIDIKDLIPGSAKLGFIEDKSGTFGVLTASDGTHVATASLSGQFSAAGFYATADGSGGTKIGYLSPSDPSYAAVHAHSGYPAWLSCLHAADNLKHGARTDSPKVWEFLVQSLGGFFTEYFVNAVMIAVVVDNGKAPQATVKRVLPLVELGKELCARLAGAIGFHYVVAYLLRVDKLTRWLDALRIVGFPRPYQVGM